MTSLDRRSLILRGAAVAAWTLAAERTAHAAGPKLAETDPNAIALGYREDTTKVDSKKFAKHQPSQNCANCQLFQGTPKDELGGCPLFAGKQVTAIGWCSAWNKKAG